MLFFVAGLDIDQGCGGEKRPESGHRPAAQGGTAAAWPYVYQARTAALNSVCNL